MEIFHDVNLETLASLVQMFNPAKRKDTGKHSRTAFPTVRSVYNCQSLYDCRIRGKNKRGITVNSGWVLLGKNYILGDNALNMFPCVQVRSRCS